MDQLPWFIEVDNNEPNVFKRIPTAIDCTPRTPLESRKGQGSNFRATENVPRHYEFRTELVGARSSLVCTSVVEELDDYV